MAKLILNSLSGKMTQRNFRDESKYWKRSEEKELREYFKQVKEKTGVDPNLHTVSSNSLFSIAKKTEADSYTNPHPSQVGVFIYAYARSYMWNLFFSKMKVEYTDTDSAAIHKVDSVLLPEHMIVSKTRAKQFGMIEKESWFNRQIVIAPKTYLQSVEIHNIEEGKQLKEKLENIYQQRILNGDDFDRDYYYEFNKEKGEYYQVDYYYELDDDTGKYNKIIKAKMKGVRKTDQWINPKNGEILDIDRSYLKLFLTLLNTGTVTIKSWSFRNFLKDGKFCHRDVTKVLTMADFNNDLNESEVEKFRVDNTSVSVL